MFIPPKLKPYTTIGIRLPRVGKCFHGLNTKQSIRAEKPSLSAVVPSGPTIGKSCLAIEAPDCMVTIAISTHNTASKKLFEDDCIFILELSNSIN